MNTKQRKENPPRTREKNLNPRVTVLKELWQLTRSCCRCPEFSVRIPQTFQGTPVDFQHQDPLLCNFRLSFPRTLETCSDCIWHIGKARKHSPPSAPVTLRQKTSWIWFISSKFPQPSGWINSKVCLAQFHSFLIYLSIEVPD